MLSFDLSKPKKITKKKFIPTKHPQYENVQPPPQFNGETLEWSERPKRNVTSRRRAPIEKPGPKNFDYKTLPGEMFMTFFQEAGDLWRKQSNRKLKELTEAHNAKYPEQKRRLYQITETDAKAVIACILHMGMNKKTNYKDYWSTDEDKKDKFVSKVIQYSQLSARKFRKVLSCIRLYDKQDAQDRGLNRKDSGQYDEHFKVMI